MSLDISRVRFERLRCIGRLADRQQELLREGGSFVAFLRLTSPEMAPAFKASGTERHQRRRESSRYSRLSPTKSSLFGNLRLADLLNISTSLKVRMEDWMKRYREEGWTTKTQAMVRLAMKRTTRSIDTRPISSGRSKRQI